MINTLFIVAIILLVLLLAFFVNIVARNVAGKYRRLQARLMWLEESQRRHSEYIAGLETTRQRKIGHSGLRGPSDESQSMLDGQWTCLGGHDGTTAWRKGDFNRSRGLASLDGSLFVGLESRTRGRAEVWQMKPGGAWRKIGGSGLNGGWDVADEVGTLAVFGNRLVAGLACQRNGASVWRWDGERWDCLGRESLGSWPAGKFHAAQNLLATNDGLLVGMWSRKAARPGRPEVHRFDGQAWRALSPPVGTCDEAVMGVYELRQHDDGALYAALGGDPGAGQIWRLADGNWEQIAGGGKRDSWDMPSWHTVLALESYDGHLIASMQRIPTIQGHFSTIWSCDGAKWAALGARDVPRQWSVMYSYNALRVFKGNLLVGAGGFPWGKASIWRLNDDGAWRLFAGFGHAGSWGSATGTEPLSSRNSGHEYVYRMIEHEGDLVAGFGARPGCAQVWRFTPKNGAN